MATPICTETQFSCCTATQTVRVGACVEKVEVSDARRHHDGPSAAAAADIHADGAGRQAVPGKDVKIGFKNGSPVVRGKCVLPLTARGI